jgi:hypothetical protein
LRIRRSLLILAIILIALNAALETTPKDVLFNIGLNPLSASPRNPSPYGTSELVDLLRANGFKVIIVGSASDIDYALKGNPDKVVIAIIAPDAIPEPDEDILLNYAGRNNYVFLLAGENINGTMTRLAERLSARLCGVRLSIANPSSEEFKRFYANTSVDSLLIRFPRGSFYTIATGYVSPIVHIISQPWQKHEGAPTLEEGEHRYVIERIGDLKYLGTVYNVSRGIIPFAVSFSISSEGSFVVVGAACGRGGGAELLLLGDSTPLTNAALEHDTYKKLALDLFSYLLGNATEGDKYVIFISDIYKSNYSIELKYHPSILLNNLILYYKSLEERAEERFGRENFALAGLLAMAVLGSALWARELLGWRASKAEGKPRPPAVRVEARPRSLKGSGGARSSALELCAFADSLLRRSLGLGVRDIEANPRLLSTLPNEELAWQVGELISLCNLIKSKGVRALLEDLSGITRRRAQSIAEIVDSIQARLSAY